VGRELDLFAAAKHWKSYLSRQLHPYIGDDVLEVGAGLGGTTRALCRGGHKRWVCLEPDWELAARLNRTIDDGRLPPCCEVIVGTLDSIADEAMFDTILYIDVLEHILDDRAELAVAERRLRAGGCLVVLSPAHPWLYTPFDAAVGHYRRYAKASLTALAPRSLELISLAYLDLGGVAASLANRVVLRQSMPTAAQIAFWDNVLVPVSRVLDPVCGYALGRSILGVWLKRAGAPLVERRNCDHSTPSLRMRARSVCGLMSSNCAAPSGPSIRP
jgi:hypothetical protein